MSISKSAAGDLLNGLVGKSSQGILGSSCYMGLSTTAPDDDGGNFTEPSHSSYGRAVIGISSQAATQVMGTPSDREIKNAKIIYFPEATGSWGTVTYFGLFSSQAGGTPKIYGQITDEEGHPTSVTITGSESAGVVPLFRVNKFSIKIE